MFASRRLDFRGIVAIDFVTFFAFAIWQVLFNNYGRETFGATASQIGIIQAVREVPGLLGFVVGLLAIVTSELRISTISIAINGLGLIIAGTANSIWMLGVGTLIMSTGFHYFVSANQSLLLNYIRGHESGRLQGVMASWEAIAGVAGTIVVFLFSFVLGYRAILVSSGVAFVVAGIVLSFFYKSNRKAEETSTFNMKKSYWLYYVISFLRGCRRHMFSTFAIFLLVANYKLKIEYTALLFFVTSAITIVTNKQLGNLTERLGERFLLAFSSFLLIFIFAGYAYVGSLYVLLVFFVIDSILYGSSVALNSYIRKIARKRDLTNALSIGLTMNHVAAVVIPIAGGVMWDTLGFRVTFIMGAVIVLADMCFSLLVKPPKNRKSFAEEVVGVEKL